MLDIFSGYKTYIAAAGLVGLGIYQISQGDVQTGVASLMAGLAVFGIGKKIERALS